MIFKENWCSISLELIGNGNFLQFPAPTSSLNGIIAFQSKTIYFWLYFDSSVVKYLLFLSSFMKMPIVLHISSVLFSIVGNFSHDDTGAYFFNWATQCNSSLTILQLIFEMHLFSFRKNIQSFILRTKYAATLPNCHLFKWIAIIGVSSCEDKFHLNQNFAGCLSQT